MPVQDRHYAWGIALLGALFFLPFLGGVHLFDWDEINFAEAAREMLVRNEYLRVYINFQPFWEKPPLFFWLQVLAMRTLGVGEYAARLPNAICGVITLTALFLIGRRLHSARLGLFWAGAYLGSVLPFLYFKSGIIDPWFNLFIFLGLYYFVQGCWSRREGRPHRAWWQVAAGGLCIGLGMLTKGPVALLVAGLVIAVYQAWYGRFRLLVSIGQFASFLLASLIVGAAWLGLETWKNGDWFVREFFAYQYRLFSTPDAGHKGFPGYHAVVLLLGCFPFSVFAVRALWRAPDTPSVPANDFLRWMKILFWVVLILFSVVQSKIVHYSSLAYFPVSYLAAYTWENIHQGRLALSGWMKALLWGIGGFWMLICAALPVLGLHPELVRPWLQDPFAQANLEAQVRWSGWEFLPGLALLAALAGFTYLSRRGRYMKAYAALSLGGAVFVWLALVFYIKRVEGYSQRAAVEFCKQRAVEDCYIVTHAYKSYVHLFYAAKRPPADERSYDKEWLLHGQDVDKPVYVMSKVHRAPELEAMPHLEKIGARNGFVFFRRKDLIR